MQHFEDRFTVRSSMGTLCTPSPPLRAYRGAELVAERLIQHEVEDVRGHGHREGWQQAGVQPGDAFVPPNELMERFPPEDTPPHALTT